jgi:hypothetical protein
MKQLASFAQKALNDPRLTYGGSHPDMNTPDRNSKPATMKTVLVLDGDVLVRMPVVQFLRDCGYRVVETAHGSAR